MMEDLNYDTTTPIKLCIQNVPHGLLFDFCQCSLMIRALPTVFITDCTTTTSVMTAATKTAQYVTLFLQTTLLLLLSQQSASGEQTIFASLPLKTSDMPTCCSNSLWG